MIGGISKNACRENVFFASFSGNFAVPFTAPLLEVRPGPSVLPEQSLRQSAKHVGRAIALRTAEQIADLAEQPFGTA